MIAFNNVLKDCPSQAELLEFSLGRLTSADIDSFAEHIETCERCCSKLNQLEDNSDVLVDDLRRWLGRTDNGADQDTAPVASASHTASAPPESSSRLGRLGHFELLEELGRGGMGVVYRAQQPGLKRTVAIKTLACVPLAAPAALKRFRIEAEAIGRLKHPHIVQVHEYGEYDGRPFLCMEFVPGRTLANLLAEGPLPASQAVAILLQLASAVQYAHQQQVLHRDLKPANVLLGTNGPKLTDFGLAKFLDIDDGHTHQHAVLGTATYMAPEQVDQRLAKVSVRTDIYGLGAVLYEMLTGQPPFTGDTKDEIFARVLGKEATPPIQLVPSISRGLDAICMKCLSKDPNPRYGTVTKLIADLERWQSGEPVHAITRRWLHLSRRSQRLATIASLMVLTLAVAGCLAYFSSPAYKHQQLQQTILGGQPVTLIQDTGGPAWRRVPVGSADATVSVSSANVFTVSTWNTCLVELLETPGVERYTVQAEVRHLASDLGGEVGVVVGYRPTVDGQGHGFAQLSWNDIRSTAEIVERLPPAFAAKLPPAVNYVSLYPHFLLARPDGHWISRKSSGVTGSAFQPAGFAGGPWRKVKLVVTPNAIATFWDDLPVDRLAVASLEEALTTEQKAVAEGNLLTPKPLPRGAVGVYVFRGTASFRNVVVTPHNDLKFKP